MQRSAFGGLIVFGERNPVLLPRTAPAPRGAPTTSLRALGIGDRRFQANDDLRSTIRTAYYAASLRYIFSVRPRLAMVQGRILVSRGEIPCPAISGLSAGRTVARRSDVRWGAHGPRHRKHSARLDRVA